MDTIQPNANDQVNWWSKLPLWIRSILIGFFVSTIGVTTWVIVATMIPAPYSIGVMGAILVFYILFFTGKLWPGKGAKFRSYSFRTAEPKPPLGLTTIAILSLFIFFNAMVIFTFRLFPFHPETFKTATYLDDVPVAIAWAFIIMASLVAGICEETGFRGYMQKPMEDYYGPVKSILLTSVIFVIVHLHQAWAGGILIQLFLVSILFGALAYATDSIIPGIIVHTLFDIVNFSYWWSNVAGTFDYNTVYETGVDLHFIITSAIGIISIMCFLYTTARMNQKRKRVPIKI